MHRLLVGLTIALLLAGCGTTPTGSETTREAVLQYLGTDSDVGTSGPFGKNGLRELDVLSPQDRRAATSLVNRGAVLFVIYGHNLTDPNATATTTRIILVQRGKVVGDFKAQPQSAPAPAPQPAAPSQS